MKQHVILRISTLFAVALGADAVHADTRVVAMTGDAAPGGNGTIAEFNRLGAPDASGQALFYAGLTGSAGGFLDDQGLFVIDADGLAAVLTQEGDASPDGDGNLADLSGGVWYDGVTNRAGQFALLADLRDTDGGSSDNSGIFRDLGDGLTAAVRKGDPVPGGTTFSYLFRVRMGPSGDAAFFAADDAGSAYGFYRIAPDGTVYKLARTGDAAPGGGGYVPGNDGTRINASGRVAFPSQITGGGYGVFASDGVTSSAILRLGDPIGGGDVAFVSRLTSFNDAGVAGINTSINGSSSTRAVLMTDGSTPEVLFRDGDALPGGGSTKVHDFDQVWANNNGAVALLVSDSSFDERILVRSGDGDWVVVAAPGGPPPNGDGAFGDLTLWDFDDDGSILFRATLTDTGEGTRRAFFVWIQGELAELVREGQAVNIDGDERTIATLGNAAVKLDGARTLAQVTFEDGTHALLEVSAGAPPTDPADVDGDGIVGVGDLLQLLGAWGDCPEPCPPSCAEDIDGDCSVSVGDLLAVLAAWD